MLTANSLRIRTGAALAAVLLGGAGLAYGNTITVNSVADVAANDGQCTLREAIIAANTNTASGGMAGECAAGASGLDTIAFNIPGAGVHTIAPASNLATITEAVIIDGYTQPGSSANTNAFPGTLNTVLLIELNLASVGPLLVTSANSTIKGLVINRGSDKIEINAPGGGVTVAGNFIGTNPAGTAASVGFVGGFAVRIDVGNNNVVGGSAAADRNLLSGNVQGGVFVGLGANDGTRIEGNFIGPDVTGTVTLGNGITGAGILVRGDNTTNTAIVGNVVSGNADGGIEDGSQGGVIQGNLIGTQRNGTSPLPNGNFGGVVLDAPGSNVTVGGSAPGQPNVIAFNGPSGFAVDVLTNGNLISQNSIYGNAFKGITLNGGGTPLANDTCDADPGPGNNKQNYPVITSAVIVAGNVTISGTLNSTASTDFTIEFFSNVACDPSGNGQGQTFLGSANVTTPVGGCDVSFGPLVFPVPAGQTVFTATATELPRNTSEFSACFTVGGPAPSATPTQTATATPLPTNTPAGVPTATPTPAPVAAAAVPTLSPEMLVLLALGLMVLAVVLLRR
jgi:CSLREA domain-containing protein